MRIAFRACALLWLIGLVLLHHHLGEFALRDLAILTGTLALFLLFVPREPRAGDPAAAGPGDAEGSGDQGRDDSTQNSLPD